MIYVVYTVVHTSDLYFLIISIFLWYNHRVYLLLYFRLANAMNNAIKPYPYTCKHANEKRELCVSQDSPISSTPEDKMIPVKNCVI
jgi:hypothetical protein